MKIEFPGDAQEQFALLNAVKHNCGCILSDEGYTLEQSGCHQLLIPNIERWKGLIFARRIAETLLAEEFTDGREGEDSPIIPYQLEQ